MKVSPDKAFSDLEVPERSQGQAFVSVEQLMELSLSSCPTTGRRCFSCLTSKKALSGGSLLLWVQRHWQMATASSSAAVLAEGEDPHAPCTEEQGKVFQENVAVIRDSLCKELALPSPDMVSKAALLSSVQRVKLPRVDMPFSPFVGQQISTDLCGEATAIMLRSRETVVSREGSFCPSLGPEWTPTR